MKSIFTIGYNIALSTSGASALAVASKELLGIHMNARQAQASLAGLGKGLGLVVAGVTLAKIGGALTGMFDQPIEKAKELQREIAKFSTYGMSAATNAEALRFAKNMNVPGSDYVASMRYVNEAQGVFRESGNLTTAKQLEGAKLAAPVMAKIDFANGVLDEQSQSKMHTQNLAMLRFIEMRGGLNSGAEFNKIADAAFKAVRSSGGNINWEQLRQFQARAGVAGFSLTDEALLGKLEPIIGELKGTSAGFAMRTSYNRINGIVRVPNQVAHHLTDAGIWDKDKVVFNSNGGIKSFKGNPLVDSALFARDPVEFYEKKLMPMYAKMGLTKEERYRENAMIFGSTGGGMFSLIDKQLPTIHRSVEAQRRQQGIDASVQTAKGTAYGVEAQQRAEFAKIAVEMGTPILAIKLAFAKTLLPALQAFAKWVTANEGKFGLIMKILFGLGLFLSIVGPIVAVIGVVMLGIAAVAAGFIAGPVLLIAGIIAGVVAAVGIVIVVIALWGNHLANFGRWIGEHAKNFGKWAMQFGATALKFFIDVQMFPIRMAIAFGQWIAKVWPSFQSAAGTLFSNIVKWFRELPANIWRSITGGGVGGAPSIGAPPPRDRQDIHVTVPVHLGNELVDRRVHRAFGVGEARTGESVFSPNMSWAGPPANY